MIEHRALILEPSGNLWGSERALLDWLREGSGPLDQIGVCCPPNCELSLPLSELPVHVFPYFVANLHLLGKQAYLRAVIGLVRAAIEFKPGLIHVNQAGTARIALIVGRALHIPVVTHVRLKEDVGYIASLKAKPHDLRKLICVSKYICDLFHQEGFNDCRRLVTIYDPYVKSRGDQVDFPSFAKDDTLMFLCVGRLARMKGQDLLLRAIHVLKKEGIRAKVLFLGRSGPGDSFDRDVTNLSQQLGIEDQVIWGGFTKQVMRHLESCTGLVCPSHTESLGRVIFEAWDAGTIPIAWAYSGGAAEVINASGGGLLYNEQTGESIAEILKRAMRMSPDERRSRIHLGREWIAQHCDVATYSRTVRELWREVSGRS